MMTLGWILLIGKTATAIWAIKVFIREYKYLKAQEIKWKK
jgi:hypothetical protein